MSLNFHCFFNGCTFSIFPFYRLNNYISGPIRVWSTNITRWVQSVIIKS